MINVTIDINGEVIRKLSARRLQDFQGKDAVHTYEMRGVPDIEHKYSDGPEILAIKMLEAVVERNQNEY